MNDFGSRLVQSSSSNYASFGKVYNSLGLTGKGVVVGVADTGLDRDHCFFSPLSTSSSLSTSNRDTDRAVGSTRFLSLDAGGDGDGKGSRRREGGGGGGEGGGEALQSNVADSTHYSPTVDLTQRKVVSYVAYADSVDDSGHGTHVCGSLAGSIYQGFHQYEGIAMESRIAFFDIGRAGDQYLRFPDLSQYVFAAAKAAGAVIHSNSWGTRLGSCNSWCTDVDEFMEANEDFLLVFAAGNSGPDEGTVAVPASAKNVVSVGSCGSGHSSASGPNVIPSWSSRGPTADGRFGVDILAPGSYLKSSKASADYGEASCSMVAMYGTSMAAPMAAGAAALIHQYFVDASFWASYCRPAYMYCRSFQPSGVLTKAVLLHSGVDLGGAYRWPGPEQGFGRIALDTVLYVPGVSQSFDLYVTEYILRSYDTVSFEIRVTSLSRALKVTATWVDPPASATSEVQLIHDLDLEVVTATGVLYRGNGGRSADRANNVEMVYISAGELEVGAEYVVRISAGLLMGNSAGTQRVAVVATSPGYVSSHYDDTYTETDTAYHGINRRNVWSIFLEGYTDHVVLRVTALFVALTGLASLLCVAVLYLARQCLKLLCSRRATVH
eukprot:gene1243-1406_t